MALRTVINILIMSTLSSAIGRPVVLTVLKPMTNSTRVLFNENEVDDDELLIGNPTIKNTNDVTDNDLVATIKSSTNVDEPFKEYIRDVAIFSTYFSNSKSYLFKRIISEALNEDIGNICSVIVSNDELEIEDLTKLESIATVHVEVVGNLKTINAIVLCHLETFDDDDRKDYLLPDADY